MAFEIFSLSFHIIYGDTIKSEGEFFMRSWGIIKRAVAALLLFSATMFLFGCAEGKAGGIKRNYTESSFCAEICWEREGERFSAKVFASAPANDGQGRELKLEFISPDSMNGVSAEFDGERAFLVCGDVRAELHNQAIIDPVKLLADVGSFSNRGATEVAGRKLLLVERVCGNEVTRIYIDKDSGVPFRVVSDKLTVDVVWFEYLS